jgi:hypothetical protein
MPILHYGGFPNLTLHHRKRISTFILFVGINLFYFIIKFFYYYLIIKFILLTVGFSRHCMFTVYQELIS